MEACKNPDNVKALLSSFLHPELLNIRKTVSEEKTKEKSPCLPEPTITRNKDAFFRRVKTYTPFLWFGKPSQISPLVCSRYGWKTVDTDTLQCVSCNVYLCAKLPCTIQPGIYDECIKKILSSLREAHQQFCIWPSSPCPESFMQISIENKMEAKEDFFRRLKPLNTAIKWLPELDCTELKVPACDITRLTAIVKPLLEDVGDTAGEDDLYRACVTLALCGWSKTAESAASSCVLQCDFCQRQSGTWNFKPLMDNDLTTDNDVSFSSQSTSSNSNGVEPISVHPAKMLEPPDDEIPDADLPVQPSNNVSDSDRPVQPCSELIDPEIPGQPSSETPDSEIPVQSSNVFHNSETIVKKDNEVSHSDVQHDINVASPIVHTEQMLSAEMVHSGDFQTSDNTVATNTQSETPGLGDTQHPLLDIKTNVAEFPENIAVDNRSAISETDVIQNIQASNNNTESEPVPLETDAVMGELITQSQDSSTVDNDIEISNQDKISTVDGEVMFKNSESILSEIPNTETDLLIDKPQIKMKVVETITQTDATDSNHEILELTDADNNPDVKFNTETDGTVESEAAVDEDIDNSTLQTAIAMSLDMPGLKTENETSTMPADMDNIHECVASAESESSADLTASADLSEIQTEAVLEVKESDQTVSQNMFSQSTPCSEGLEKDEEPPTKKRKTMVTHKLPFNPVLEHRTWCPRVLPIMPSDNSPSWQPLLKLLLSTMSPAGQRGLWGSVRETPPHEGLRSIRRLFQGWTSPQT